MAFSFLHVVSGLDRCTALEEGCNGTWKSVHRMGTHEKSAPCWSACFSLQPSQGEDGGQGWIRTSEVVRQQIYSLPRLAAPEPTLVCSGTET